jgi:hypothetical protein
VIDLYRGVDMAKDLTITMLMDFYGQLLTDKQLTALDMYYNEDLSLGEIAEEYEISRQGVRDNIKRGERQLCEYEEKLGLAKRFLKISAGINEMNAIIDSLIPDGSKENEEKLAAMKTLAENLTSML